MNKPERVIVLIKGVVEVEEVEVFGTITALTDKYKNLSGSTIQKHLSKDNVYFSGDLSIWRREKTIKRRQKKK